MGNLQDKLFSQTCIFVVDDGSMWCHLRFNKTTHPTQTKPRKHGRASNMPRYTATEFILTLTAALIAVAIVCNWLNSLNPTVIILG
jgi:hypothetical protein